MSVTHGVEVHVVVMVFIFSPRPHPLVSCPP